MRRRIFWAALILVFALGAGGFFFLRDTEPRYASVEEIVQRLEDGGMPCRNLKMQSPESNELEELAICQLDDSPAFFDKKLASTISIFRTDDHLSELPSDMPIEESFEYEAVVYGENWEVLIPGRDASEKAHSILGGSLECVFACTRTVTVPTEPPANLKPPDVSRAEFPKALEKVIRREYRQVSRPLPGQGNTRDENNKLTFLQQARVQRVAFFMARVEFEGKMLILAGTARLTRLGWMIGDLTGGPFMASITGGPPVFSEIPPEGSARFDYLPLEERGLKAAAGVVDPTITRIRQVFPNGRTYDEVKPKHKTALVLLEIGLSQELYREDQLVSKFP